MGLTCVLAAYNEAPRIAAVLRVVVGHPLIDEVIVVDDGSRDGTADVAETVAGIRLIRLAENRGKSWAVAEGIAAASHDLILLLDSDLLGLAPEAVSALIAPVRDGTADAALSLRGNTPLPWRVIGLDYISGERVISRSLIGDPQALRALPRFGLELHLNQRLIAARARIAVVRWPGVASPWKGSKRGVLAGILADLRMLTDMFATVPLHRAAWQIVVLRQLRACG